MRTDVSPFGRIDPGHPPLSSGNATHVTRSGGPHVVRIGHAGRSEAGHGGTKRPSAKERTMFRDLLNVLRGLFTREHLRRDLRTAAVALLVSGLVMATPSVAARVTNADKVDGKHAVGAGASVATRRGKLVATNRYGYLPNNIVRKVRDADRLDGQQRVVPDPGRQTRRDPARRVGRLGWWRRELRRGHRGLREDAPGSDSGDSDHGPGLWRPVHHRVPRGGAGRAARLVVRLHDRAGHVTGLNSYNGTDGLDPTSKVGFGVWGSCGAASCYQYGQLGGARRLRLGRERAQHAGEAENP